MNFGETVRRDDDANSRRFSPIKGQSARSAIGALAIRASAAARRVGVAGGQHPQQGGPAAGAGRLASSTNPGDGAGPFESSMNGGRLLTIVFAHRKKLPGSNATLTRWVVAPPFPWAVEEHESLNGFAIPGRRRRRPSRPAAHSAGVAFTRMTACGSLQVRPREADTIRSIGPGGLTLSQSDESASFFTRDSGRPGE